MDFSSNIEPQNTRSKSVAGGVAIPSRSGVEEPEPTWSAVLAALLSASTQPFVTLDGRGRVVLLNRSLAELIGQGAEAVAGRAFADLAVDAVKAEVAEAIDGTLVSGGPVQFETVLGRPDGVEVPVGVSLEPEWSRGRELQGLHGFVHDFTGHDRARKALRESEERFRRLYDEAPVGYHEVDTEGRIVNINQTECDLLGYDREALIGRPVFEVIAEDSREAARAAFPDKVSGRTPLRPFERTVVTRDGRSLVLAIVERHKRDANGTITGLLTTVRDVTDRQRAEAALHASERRARTLFEGMREAVIVHDATGHVLDANPAASLLLGYPRPELVGMTIDRLEGPALDDGHEERLAAQVSSGHSCRECRYLTKAGRLVPVEINATTILFEGERAVLAVVRDISERQALEEARRALAESRERSAREIASKNVELTLSEKRYRTLTEGCLDGVIASDEWGTITLINPAACRMFGYESAEVVGHHLAFLMPNAFEDFDGAGGAEALAGRTAEVIGRRKGGEEFPVELSLNSVEVGGEARYVGSLRDQTERQRMRAALAQSEKLASIGLLSAGVAHEINNPLAYVGNNLAVLERDLGGARELLEAYESLRPTSPPEALARVDAISDDIDWPYIRENLPKMLARTREGVQRVSTIVSSLRGLARMAPPVMEEASVTDLLDSALELLRGRLRRHHIEVLVDVGNAPKLVCVASQINQVVLNLLINAAQAVEASGRVEGGCIRVTAERRGAFLQVSVSDDGVGIPPEHLPRLFDPFFTTKSVGEGTGLGLSICHGIVTGHGGSIEVESLPGQGTTFRLLLPLRPS